MMMYGPQTEAITFISNTGLSFILYKAGRKVKMV